MFLPATRLTFSNASLRTRGSYGADGIASTYQGGLYHLSWLPPLLVYMCPGGKTSKRLQSSFSPFISDDIHTEPACMHSEQSLRGIRSLGGRRSNESTFESPADVERSDSDRISSSNEAVVARIQQHEREDPIQHIHEPLAIFLVLSTINGITEGNGRWRWQKQGQKLSPDAR